MLNKAIKNAVKEGKTQVNWIEAVLADPLTVGNFEKLLEISHIRLLKTSIGTDLPVSLYRDFFRTMTSIEQFKFESLLALFKEYENVGNEKESDSHDFNSAGSLARKLQERFSVLVQVQSSLEGVKNSIKHLQVEREALA